MYYFGASVLVLICSSNGDTEHIGLAVVTFEDTARIEHGCAASKIAIDPLHICIVINKRSLGIEIVCIGGSIFD